MPAPEAVGDHARRERMLVTREPIREPQSSARRFVTDGVFGLGRSQYIRPTTRYRFITQGQVIAPDVHGKILGLAFAHSHRQVEHGDLLFALGRAFREPPDRGCFIRQDPSLLLLSRMSLASRLPELAQTKQREFHRVARSHFRDRRAE